MVAQLVAKRAKHLAGRVRHHGFELGVLPSEPMPTRKIGIGDLPTFDFGGSTAGVTWLGSVAHTSIAPAHVLGAPRPEFEVLHRSGVPAREMTVLALPGASLATDGGAVVTADGQLVYDTLWDAAHFERSEFNSEQRLPRAKVIPG